MVHEKIADSHSSLALGIKIHGILWQGEFLYKDVKTI
jgi:hypothetical protein